MLPRRIPKQPKRESRWRSQRHCTFIRQHHCTNCGSAAGIEVAHVRIGSGAGMGQKPNDWHAVALCGGPEGCHTTQHRQGEQTFWDAYMKREGHTVWDVIEAFCKDSPVSREITESRRERAND